MTLGNQRGEAYATALLALTLTALVVATAAPNFSSMYDTYAMYGASRRVMGDLRKARVRAATENNPYAIALLDAHSYTIHDDDDGDGVVDAGENVQTIDVGGEWTRVALAFSGPVVFRPSGYAGGARTIAFSNRLGNTRTVSVSAAGRVQLEAPGRTREP